MKERARSEWVLRIDGSAWGESAEVVVPPLTEQTKDQPLVVVVPKVDLDTALDLLKCIRPLWSRPIPVPAALAMKAHYTTDEVSQILAACEAIDALLREYELLP